MLIYKSSVTAAGEPVNCNYYIVNKNHNPPSCIVRPGSSTVKNDKSICTKVRIYFGAGLYGYYSDFGTSETIQKVTIKDSSNNGVFHFYVKSETYSSFTYTTYDYYRDAVKFSLSDTADFKSYTVIGNMWHKNKDMPDDDNSLGAVGKYFAVDIELDCFGRLWCHAVGPHRIRYGVIDEDGVYKRETTITEATDLEYEDGFGNTGLEPSFNITDGHEGLIYINLFNKSNNLKWNVEETYTTRPGVGSFMAPLYHWNNKSSQGFWVENSEIYEQEWCDCSDYVEE